MTADLLNFSFVYTLRTIFLTSNPSLCMTVCTTALKNYDKFGNIWKNGIYNRARLIVTKRKTAVDGNANQVFWLEKDRGYLHAFATDLINIGRLKNLTYDVLKLPLSMLFRRH